MIHGVGHARRAGSLSRTGSEILAAAERTARARRPEVQVSVELVSDRSVRVLAKRSENALEVEAHAHCPVAIVPAARAS